jgi:formylglycine-generating enzyme required for sulfatase activity
VQQAIAMLSAKPGTPASSQWYILKGGVPTGPFAQRSVQDQITTGQLTPVDQVCPVGESTWRDASKAFSFNSPEGLGLAAHGQQQAKNASFQPPKVSKEPIYTNHRDSFRGPGKRQFQPYYLLIPSLVAIGGVVAIVVFAAINSRIPAGADLALEAAGENTSAPGLNAPAEPAANEVTNSIGMKLKLIPAGTFMMGSPENAARRSEDEPEHQVRITKPYYLGMYEVTQGEYERVMGTNPSHFSASGNGSDEITGMDTSRFPVELVSWDDAAEYCRRLSALPAERAAGRVYRLPTEAEWEYACRAGTTTPFHFGSQLTSQQANFEGKYPTSGSNLYRPAIVGSYESNGYGLFDMHGNVWEWCSDWYGDYPASAQVDPLGAATGSSRVRRGGGWFLSAGFCRSAFRAGLTPGYRLADVGFRVALSSVVER